MYFNLKTEMMRKGITQTDIANLIGVDRNTVNNKINGKCKFYFDEAVKIHQTMFPEADIYNLFEKEEKKNVKS